MTETASAASGNVAVDLGEDEVHVWHFAYHREQARRPLLDLLARYLGTTADEVRLVIGEHGRPRLAHATGPALDFNWSHCADHAVVALARRVAPGIDIELLEERGNALRLAQRYFHPGETAAIAALPAPARSAAFLELWTAKEAVLKAIGRGIAFGLHRLHVAGGSAPRLLWLDGDDIAAWQLQRVYVDARHVAALAWRGGRGTVQVRALGTPAQAHDDNGSMYHAWHQSDFTMSGTIASNPTPSVRQP